MIEHMPEAVGLAAREEAAERGMGVLLAKPVKIEPGVDLAAAARDTLGRARVEGFWRRRGRCACSLLKERACAGAAKRVLRLRRLLGAPEDGRLAATGRFGYRAAQQAASAPAARRGA